jgi:hypothetical protein
MVRVPPEFMALLRRVFAQYLHLYTFVPVHWRENAPQKVLHLTRLPRHTHGTKPLLDETITV